MIAKYLNKLLAVLRGKALTNLSFKKKALLKKQKQRKNALQNPVRRNVDGKDASEVRAYLIILLVLIPYFLSVTGVTYQMFGYPRAIILNSEGEQYDLYYVHDQESYGAKWLKGHAEEGKIKVYGDRLSTLIMVSQATMSLGKNAVSIREPRKVMNYVYLRYDNVINERLYIKHECHNMTEYSIMFVGKSEIYNNGGSEIHR